MLLLTAATVLASSNHGWPCTRMNWAWRNVWSTCSINSYVPADGTGTADQAPAHWRRGPLSAALGPTNILTASGEVSPVGAAAGAQAGVNAQVPNMICTNMDATRANTWADFGHLRNRCRRAIDAYGGIVRSCTLPPNQGGNRGPITSSIFTNFVPGADHSPHVTNVRNLATIAHRCTSVVQPGTFVSPHTTCPGLLGWWSVVWTACGFRAFVPTTSGATGIPAGVDSQANPNVIPLGGELTPKIYAATAPVAPAPDAAGSPAFYFCSPANAEIPSAWNRRGPSFRTSRCRRALDQFGRTAARCGGTTAAASPPAWGTSDPLRRVMIGGAVAAATPNSLGQLAPICN